MATVLAAGLVILTGCENREQTGAAVGASIGAIACGVAGSAIFNNTLGTVLPAAACSAVGYFVGSAIGRQLDAQDQQQAATATERALAVPVKPPQAGSSRPVKAKASTWKSAHGSGASGSATVTEVEKKTDGAECRTVREVAYIKGQEVVQNSRYCRSGEGEWQAVSA
ncbi:MAG: glycine zipper domain-containing protein [Geminicoccaceae bacterium]